MTIVELRKKNYTISVQSNYLCPSVSKQCTKHLSSRFGRRGRIVQKINGPIVQIILQKLSEAIFDGVEEWSFSRRT